LVQALGETVFTRIAEKDQIKSDLDLMLLGPKRFFSVPSAPVSFDRIAEALRWYHNDAIVGQKIADKVYLHTLGP
jgi:hypothetical protein